MNDFLVPAGYGECELIEKKSRFIGRVWPVYTLAEALERIQEMRILHKDATHNVFAYSIKAENAVKVSDDGEPAKTAGMPVYEVFNRQQIHNFCCVVTRYFGGTLLGAGGLTRAYSNTAKLALDTAGIAVIKQYVIFTLDIDYTFFDKVKLFFGEFEAEQTGIDYSDRVKITGRILKEDFLKLKEQIFEYTSSKCEFEIIEEVWQ